MNTYEGEPEISAHRGVRVKMLSAVVGASAVLALGAMSIALRDEAAGSVGVLSHGAPSATMGATTSWTTAPASLEVTKAVPAITPTPSEQQAAE